jgi:glutathione peroxidase-family protein
MTKNEMKWNEIIFQIEENFQILERFTKLSKPKNWRNIYIYVEPIV